MKVVGYPEHEKLAALEDKNQTIGDFIEWLGEHGMMIAERHEHSEGCWDEDGDSQCGLWEEALSRTTRNRNWFIAQFFGIDEKKLEEEKRSLLEEFRAGRQP